MVTPIFTEKFSINTTLIEEDFGIVLSVFNGNILLYREKCYKWNTNHNLFAQTEIDVFNYNITDLFNYLIEYENNKIVFKYKGENNTLLTTEIYIAHFIYIAQQLFPKCLFIDEPIHIMKATSYGDIKNFIIYGEKGEELKLYANEITKPLKTSYKFNKNGKLCHIHKYIDIYEIKKNQYNNFYEEDNNELMFKKPVLDIISMDEYFKNLYSGITNT